MADVAHTAREQAVHRTLVDLGRRSVFEIRSTLTPVVSLDCDDQDLRFLNAKLFKSRQLDLSRCTEVELQLSPEQQAIAYQVNGMCEMLYSTRAKPPTLTSRVLPWNSLQNSILGNAYTHRETPAKEMAQELASSRSWQMTTHKFAIVLFNAIKLYRSLVFQPQNKPRLLLDLLLIVINMTLDESWLNDPENVNTAYINDISLAQWFFVAREICYYSLVSDGDVKRPVSRSGFPKESNFFRLYPAHKDRSLPGFVTRHIGRIGDIVASSELQQDCDAPNLYSRIGLGPGVCQNAKTTNSIQTRSMSRAALQRISDLDPTNHRLPNLGAYRWGLDFWEYASKASPHVIAQIDYRYRMRRALFEAEKNTERRSVELEWRPQTRLRMMNNEWMTLQQLRELFKQYRIFWQLDQVPTLECYNTNGQIQPGA